jgi:thiamine-monophosphate kinase
MLREGTAGLDDVCVRRYLYPEPRVRAGLMLGRNRAATSCIDTSDGLSDAIQQIASASGVGAVIQAGLLPIEPSARAWFDAHGSQPAARAAAAGDDYELAFTVGPRSAGRLKAVIRHGGVPLTRVGVCTAGSGVVLEEDGLETAMLLGYKHFG